MRYLFQRPGSSNWWIKLQSPGKRTEKSLRTSDRHEAEILALPLIEDHKRALLAARPRYVAGYKLEPGRTHPGSDGGSIVATTEQLIYLSASGEVEKTERNHSLQLVNWPGQPSGINPAGGDIDWQPKVKPESRLKNGHGDDGLFDAYVRHAELTGSAEREARHVWQAFRTLTGNKPLKDCDRDDGRRLVAHFTGVKSTTVLRKLKPLVAAVNWGVDEGKLPATFRNPFSGVVPKRDDAMQRLPLAEEDMAACRARLDRLSEHDRNLWHLLACTGMRRGEAFQIDKVQVENGVRFVIVGSKTAQSRRRVPLPDCVSSVTFKGTAKDVGGRLNAFIRACGILDKAKVLHSLRHRAADRLRAAGCPESIRHELLGHEKKTVASGYGVGSPVTLLKEWQDRIKC